MEKNLYEYFACASREELYKKVEKRDDSVKELLHYFEYVKKDLGLNFTENKKVVKNQIELKEYYSEGNMPNKKEISLLILDVGCRVIKDFKGKENLDNLEFVKSCYTKTGRNFILMNNGCSYKKVNSIKEIFDKLGIKCIDELEVRNKNVYSPHNGEEINWNLNKNWFSREENLISYEIPEEKGLGLSNLKGYDDFLEYYTRKELTGLNILLDEKRINEILILKNQHLGQEHFSILNYDENFNISDYSIKYIGTVDRSPIETLSVIPDLLNEKINGIIITHNHPSGNFTPSPSDVKITKEFEDLCKFFNKRLYDHIIVSKTGSFSFRKENLVDDISNEIKSKLEKQKKDQKIEVNKIYAFVLEGTDRNNKEMALIAEANLNKNGIAEVYAEAKKLYKDGYASKIKIFGIDKDGNFYQGSPYLSNYEYTPKKYAEGLLEGWKEANQKEKKFVLNLVSTIDKQYNVGLEKLYMELNEKKGKEIQIKKKNIKIPKKALDKESNENEK